MTCRFHKIRSLNMSYQKSARNAKVYMCKLRKRANPKLGVNRTSSIKVDILNEQHTAGQVFWQRPSS